MRRSLPPAALRIYAEVCRKAREDVEEVRRGAGLPPVEVSARSLLKI